MYMPPIFKMYAEYLQPYTMEIATLVLLLGVAEVLWLTRKPRKAEDNINEE
jgi:hypothetical protein